MSPGSFEMWWVDRTTHPASQIEGTMTFEWVAEYVAEARHDGYEVEDGGGYARVVFERSPDGRPWKYAELYPVAPSPEEDSLVTA